MSFGSPCFVLCAWDWGRFLDDFVTSCGASNPSSLVLKSLESRAPSIGDFRVLEKTPFLLGISSIPLFSWSDSLIPSVDMFTRSLWSCLQNLMGFGPRLIIRSSISQTENRAVFLGQNFSLSPVEPAFVNDQPVIKVFSAWQGFLCVHRLISWIFAFHCVGSTGANVFAYTGALSFCLLIVGSTGACFSRAAGSVSSVKPTYSSLCTSDQPVIYTVLNLVLFFAFASAFILVCS